MRTLVFVLGLVGLTGVGPLASCAEEPSDAAEGQGHGGVRCEQMVFCAAVADRTPAGVSDTFPSDIFSVYCFTTVVGAVDTTVIVQNWYCGETKMASVELAVKSPRWRTWSSKRMIPGWRGQWRVDITTVDGAVIESGKFTLE